MEALEAGVKYVQIQQWKHQNDVIVVVLVTYLTLFSSVPISPFQTYFTSFSSVFVVDFEQLNVSWVMLLLLTVTMHFSLENILINDFFLW